MFVDFVLNGQGVGPVGSQMAEMRFDPGLRRPFIDKKGVKCVMMRTGMIYNNVHQVWVPKTQKVAISALKKRDIDHPTWNASMLTKDAWIQLDTAVLKAARPRLRAWDDLRASSTIGGFDAMGKLTLEYQSMSDDGEAIVDMDGMSDGRTDQPLADIKSIPLPITHSDFYFSERQMAVSRNGGMPLPTAKAETAGRRVAEVVEKTTIGVETGVTYGTRSTGPNPMVGTSTVYGMTNFPYRITKTDLNTPAGTNPDAVMTDVLEMIELAVAQNYFGPYILYTSTGYSRYMSDDYYRSGSTSAVRSLRMRIMEIEGIQDIRRLDYLTSGYQLILVQQDSETGQAINGMEIQTVMWESQGGMRKNFKVMCIQVPLFKARYNQTTGIVHATAA